MSDTTITEDTTVTTDDAATSAVDPPNGQSQASASSTEGQSTESVDYKAKYEEQGTLLDEFREQLEQMKEFTGFKEESEEPDEAEPTAKEKELSASLEEARTVLKEHAATALKGLPEEKQALVKELGGDDPAAQMRVINSLRKAGVFGKAKAKNKNERGSHQGRADADPATRKPKDLRTLRNEAIEELRALQGQG